MLTTMPRTKESGTDDYAGYGEILESLTAERDALREFAQAFKHWVDNDAPVEEWDGGSLGYEVGGLYSMAAAALERPE